MIFCKQENIIESLIGLFLNNLTPVNFPSNLTIYLEIEVKIDMVVNYANKDISDLAIPNIEKPSFLEQPIEQEDEPPIELEDEPPIEIKIPEEIETPSKTFEITDISETPS